jgi:hypothetical protein
VTNVQDDPDLLWARVTRLKQLTELIEELTRRRWVRSWSLPLLYLATPLGAASLVPSLDRLLGQRGRQIPHVYLRVTGHTVEELVKQIAAGLRREVFGSRALRLPRFTLLCRVLAADLGDGDNPRRALNKELTKYYTLKPDSGGLVERVPSLLGYVLAKALFWALPGLLLWLGNRRAMAWFASYAKIWFDQKTEFHSFASRFTAGSRDAEDPADLRQLMVAALLADLRFLYRRGRGRRHLTSYPIVLLDDVGPVNAGGELLVLIDELRAKDGGDPLLVIAAGRPDDVDDPASLEDLGSRYQVWLGDLGRGGHREWFLGVALPTEDLAPAAQRLRPIQARRPPRSTHPVVRLTAFGLVPTMLVGATAVWTLSALGLWDEGCASWHAPGTGTIDVTPIGNECIGLSDSSHQLLGGSQDTTTIEKTVFAQNAAAAGHHGQPLLTLVYLTSLTLPGKPGDQYVAEREGLAGVAAAQRQANREAEQDTGSPYVRVVVANAGQLAAHAGKVADKIINLSNEDRSVLAVISAVDSRTTPARALQKITDAHLMVITPTMTADDVLTDTPLFLQLSALNGSAAQLVRHYVTAVVGKTQIFNFYTYGEGRGGADGGDDLYVTSLAKDLRRRFGDAHYQDAFWTDGNSLRGMCADRYPGVVFFGGRYTEFYRFVRQISDDCDGVVPTVVADGSIGRFLANPKDRGSAPPTVPVAYVADGYLGTCKLLKASQQAEPTLYLRLLGDSCDKGTLAVEAAGWSVLSFDSVRLTTRGMRQAITDGGGPGGHWQDGQVNATQIVTSIKNKIVTYPGATGPILFGPAGKVVDRYQSILCVRDISQAYADESHLPFEVDSAGATNPTAPETQTQPCG